MLVNQVSPVFRRVETFRFCMCDEMPCPDGDVANFIVKNAREYPGTAQIALRAYAGEHGGSDIEPASTMGTTASRAPTSCRVL